MRRYFRRPTGSAVIATVALVAAMGGTSYAAKQITSSGIKNNTIKSTDIKNNSVTSTDIKNGSLRAKDFKSSDVPTGPAGPAGAPGPAGIGVVTYAVSDLVDVADGDETFIDATCPAGFVPTGGGLTSNVTGDVVPNSSYPSAGGGDDTPGAGGWGVYVDNFSGTTSGEQVFAVCAPATVAKSSASATLAKHG
jgi:hypothetical protein